MKTLAVLTNSGYHGKLNDTYKHLEPLKPGANNTLFAPVRGVNVMLGGVMLSAIILVIFVMCYCCHKAGRKTPTTNQPQPSTYWRDPGLSMEIYTVDTQNYMEMDYDECSSDSRRSSLPGPPPPYELVVPNNEDKQFETPSTPQLPENLEPPSYEKACQLQQFQITARGYV